MIQSKGMTLLSNDQKPLDSFNALDRKKEIQKRRAEQEELVDLMGQEDEAKAAPYVKKYVKELEDREREVFFRDVEMLVKLSNDKQKYQRHLLSILGRNVAEEEIPKKYEVYAESTDEGIVLGLEKTNFIGAFKVSGLPEYDIRGCKTLAVKLGNTVGRLEGNFTTTDSGIIIPQPGDLEIATKNHGRSSR